jgi:hypothetical protein
MSGCNFLRFCLLVLQQTDLADFGVPTADASAYSKHEARATDTAERRMSLAPTQFLELSTLAETNRSGAKDDGGKPMMLQQSARDVFAADSGQPSVAERNRTWAPPPAGIGIIVKPEPDSHGHFRIETVVRGSPADLTGRVHESDVLEAVDSSSVQGCTSGQLREWVIERFGSGKVSLTVRKAADGDCWKQGDSLQVSPEGHVNLRRNEVRWPVLTIYDMTYLWPGAGEV